MSARRGIGLARSLSRDLRSQRSLSTAAQLRVAASAAQRPRRRPCAPARPSPASAALPSTCWRGEVRSASSDAATSAAAAPKKTPLYDFHVSKGGKMVEFGGFSMPVTYSDMTISESSLWTRENASLFDVSHMLQHELSGPGAAAFLASITPIDPQSLPPFHSSLSALLHPTGGIVDDCIITNLGTRDGVPVFYFVTNAGNRDKDIKYLAEQLKTFQDDAKNDKVDWKMLTDNGLIAVQGPAAAEVLTQVGAVDPKDGSKWDFNKLYFGQCAYIRFGDMARPCLVSRGGYTGEDGFEISVPSAGRLGENKTLKLAELLLKTSDKLRLAGLGARDTLRLEAGMCLYGHDIDDTTTPVEAGLSWIIPKSRRATGGFLGADTILSQLKPKKDGGSGVSRRRVGFTINDKAPAREGCKIVSESGEEIGVITSGGPSPCLGKNIAMGYIKDGMHKSGTEVGVVVRNKTRKAVVTKMPFVPSKYFKGS
ncbi:glycine cleavage system T protein [Verruconis gallopava]|uniref:Aminomethyltransferase n=1 Tax=Verruconis gallopava TaxID=253628 RepID=A0A0D1ZXN3_9PEZI|nr:glycine cleavage system T protein [Verruconis gallopava]KIV98839.1 glycine cleavage system T protein [Verruconis gallopava]